MLPGLSGHPHVVLAFRTHLGRWANACPGSFRFSHHPQARSPAVTLKCGPAAWSQILLAPSAGISRGVPGPGPGREPSSPQHGRASWLRDCLHALRPRQVPHSHPRGVHGPLGGPPTDASASPGARRPAGARQPSRLVSEACRLPVAPGREAQDGSGRGAPGPAGFSLLPPQRELGQRVPAEPGPQRRVPRGSSGLPGRRREGRRREGQPVVRRAPGAPRQLFNLKPKRL